jgi:hypothetical protein
MIATLYDRCRPLGLLALLATGLLALELSSADAAKGRGSVRNSSKSTVSHRNVNQNRNVNVNQNRNVNVNQNVNVNRNVNVDRDIDVDRHYHVDVDYDDDDWGDGRFFAGLVVGAAVASSPPASQTVVVAGSPYYYSSGTYYVQSGSGYTVVAPPMGAVVSVLPTGAVQTTWNGMSVFSVNNVYYQPLIQNGATVYKVVKV